MFSQVSVCAQSASSILVHCSALLRRGRYTSYWNAFLFLFCLFFYSTKFSTLKSRTDSLDRVLGDMYAIICSDSNRCQILNLTLVSIPNMSYMRRIEIS